MEAKHSVNRSRGLTVAFAGTLLMMMLGTTYAWSYFQDIITRTTGWTQSGVAWAFSLNIAFLGLAAAFGGPRMMRFGPRRMALLGVLLYSLGFVLGAVALHKQWLWLLILGYGVVGGSGIGLSYVTPVVTAARWFPKRQGLITGMVVMGFGFGALLMSKWLAPVIMQYTDGMLPHAFLWLAAAIAVPGLLSAALIQMPPEQMEPQNSASAQQPGRMEVRKSLGSRNFIVMWLLLFINVSAGIMFIGFQSPLMQDLWAQYDPETALQKAWLASVGATLIAISAVFNGLGRIFWGAVSDRIGRVQTFRLILFIQLIVFVSLLFVSNPYVFAALVSLVLLGYGGGFGTMPSFVRDMFGSRLMPALYGAILTAWSLAGITGPQLLALLKDHAPAQAAPMAFVISAALMLAGLLLSLLITRQGDDVG